MTDTSKDTAVIFDLDGTLADTTHRLHHLTKEPKDWDGFFNGMENDPPHEEMIDLASMFDLYTDHAILVVSGRTDKYQEQTHDWLRRNEVPWSALFMRPEGDRRPDHIVKCALYRDRIKPLYDVKAVFDDRPDVVRMWRNEGLRCFAINDGPWWTPSDGIDDPIEYMEWLNRQHESPLFEKVIKMLHEGRATAKQLKEITERMNNHARDLENTDDVMKHLINLRNELQTGRFGQRDIWIEALNATIARAEPPPSLGGLRKSSGDDCPQCGGGPCRRRPRHGDGMNI